MEWIGITIAAISAAAAIFGAVRGESARREARRQKGITVASGPSQTGARYQVMKLGNAPIFDVKVRLLAGEWSNATLVKRPRDLHQWTGVETKQPVIRGVVNFDEQGRAGLIVSYSNQAYGGRLQVVACDLSNGRLKRGRYAHLMKLAATSNPRPDSEPQAPTSAD